MYRTGSFYQRDLSLSLTVTGRLGVNSIYQHVFVFKLDIISRLGDSSSAGKNCTRAIDAREREIRAVGSDASRIFKINCDAINSK